MMKKMYYYEKDRGYGNFVAESDKDAFKYLYLEMKSCNLIVLYRERNTQDGTPYVILAERKKLA